MWVTDKPFLEELPSSEGRFFVQVTLDRCGRVLHPRGRHATWSNASAVFGSSLRDGDLRGKEHKP